MFHFHINKIFIKDNGDLPAFLDPFNLFGTDEAEIDFYSFITTPENCQELVPSLVGINDAAKGDRPDLVRAAVRSVAGQREMKGIEGIRDNHTIPFGAGGYSLYRHEKIPEYLDWTLLAIERDDDVRQTGAFIEEILQDKGFDGFTTSLVTVIGAAANPAYAGAIAVGKFVVAAIVRILKKNQDDRIGVLYRTLVRQRHYPFGQCKYDNEWDLTVNMRVDYETFAYE